MKPRCPRCAGVTCEHFLQLSPSLAWDGATGEVIDHYDPNWVPPGLEPDPETPPCRDVAPSRTRVRSPVAPSPAPRPVQGVLDLFGRRT